MPLRASKRSRLEAWAAQTEAPYPVRVPVRMSQPARRWVLLSQACPGLGPAPRALCWTVGASPQMVQQLLREKAMSEVE